MLCEEFFEWIRLSPLLPQPSHGQPSGDVPQINSQSDIQIDTARPSATNGQWTFGDFLVSEQVCDMLAQAILSDAEAFPRRVPQNMVGI